MRLLITGSRDWDHHPSVDEVLAYYTRQAHYLGGRLKVAHGKATRGGDDLAAAWVKLRNRNGWPVDQEPHSAHWSAPCPPECPPGHRQRKDGREWCPRAGHRRNQEMVDRGALACVGFWRNGSSGTRDCLERAEKAGIRCLKITWQERELVTQEWLAEHAPQLVVT
jgi:hypothetical protein